MNGFATCRGFFGGWVGYDSDAEVTEDGSGVLMSFGGLKCRELMDL